MIPQVFTFTDKPFTVIEYKGQPAFLAREVGDALAYSDSGAALVDSITRHWSAELPEGSHVVRLQGDELTVLKASLPVEMTGSRARHLLLLTERGLYRVLMLAGGPKAVAFRDWLDGVVLPSLRKTGSYAIPGAHALSPAAWLRSLPRGMPSIPDRTIEELAELAQVEQLAGAELPGIRALFTHKAATQADAEERVIHLLREVDLDYDTLLDRKDRAELKARAKAERAWKAARRRRLAEGRDHLQHVFTVLRQSGYAGGRKLRRALPVIECIFGAAEGYATFRKLLGRMLAIEGQLDHHKGRAYTHWPGLQAEQAREDEDLVTAVQELGCVTRAFVDTWPGWVETLPAG